MDEVYELETVEQMRALADDLRQRILDAMGDEPITATQVSERLGIAPPRGHYHVRELERVGLVRLVETREKGGILEKYFQPIARNLVIPPSLIRRDREGVLAATADFVQDVSSRVLAALSRAQREEDRRHFLALERVHLWATRDEMTDLLKRQSELFEPYMRARGAEGEEERTVAWFVYPTHLAEEPSDPQGEARRVVTAGFQHFERSSLESLRDAGERLDITVYGMCTFGPDVPADLVAEVVARFRMHGKLVAPDAVRQVLSTRE